MRKIILGLILILSSHLVMAQEDSTVLENENAAIALIRKIFVDHTSYIYCTNAGSYSNPENIQFSIEGSVCYITYNWSSGTSFVYFDLKEVEFKSVERNDGKNKLSIVCKGKSKKCIKTKEEVVVPNILVNTFVTEFTDKLLGAFTYLQEIHK
ncbi:MAG: hypothetical protein LBN11_05005 [Tannerella sp.]|jgi:hypothetical protein|nr:hypothetical protein [Tannerella sp.]